MLQTRWSANQVVYVDHLINWFCTRGHTNLLVPRRGILI